MMDTYSLKDKQARCSECGKFMPWENSRLVEKSDGMPLPSPVLIEHGMCGRCEDIFREAYEKQRHEEEMHELERIAMEEHFTLHPHG